MSLDVGTKCETCLPSVSLETGLNMFVLRYKTKRAKKRSNWESRGFVTEGVEGRMTRWQSIFKQIPKDSSWICCPLHREGIP